MNAITAGTRTSVRITAFINNSSGKKEGCLRSPVAIWIGIGTLWRSLLGKSSAGCLFRVCRWWLSIKKKGLLAKPRNVKTVGLFVSKMDVLNLFSLFYSWVGCYLKFPKGILTADSWWRPQLLAMQERGGATARWGSFDSASIE